MLLGKSIAVTMPAYYAARTVERMWNDIPRDVVDHVIFVDDASKDDGYEIAKRCGMQAHRNERNLNYGGNVKRCLQLGLDSGADIVILLHPDCQYTPKLIPAMAAMLTGTPFDICLASRTSGRGALKGGMPVWRYIPNRALTSVMDVCLGVRHTEFHTGYRAYTRRLLETIPFHSYSNTFIFDNEALIGALEHGFLSCEVTCPTVYEPDSSSIPFGKSVRYGLECLRISVPYLFRRLRRTAGAQRPGPASASAEK